jgi:archaeosortase C (PEF-CTERM variant)
LVFLAPFAIPRVGGSLTFTFTVILTLFAWLVLKWDKLKTLEPRVNVVDIFLGLALIVGDFAQNILLKSGFGLVDQLVTLVGLSISFYGVKKIRFFVLPAAYIGILIAGYFAENHFTQVAVLELWQAGLMASLLSSLGVHAAVAGNVVTFASGSIPLSFEIAGPCTGIKGMLAFGTLSTMAVLDIKVSKRKLALMLGVGFVGAFMINLVRLATIFLAAYYVGSSLALQIHTYLGYSLFLAWVLVFWFLAFKYLVPMPTSGVSTATPVMPARLDTPRK